MKYLIIAFFLLCCTPSTRAQTCTLTQSANNTVTGTLNPTTVSGIMTNAEVLITYPGGTTINATALAFGMALDATTGTSSIYASTPNNSVTLNAGTPVPLITFDFAPAGGNSFAMNFYYEVAAQVFQGTCSLNTTTLPLELIAFNAVENKGEVNLTWDTEYERDIAEYIIERSTDGYTFSTIGSVTAKGSEADYNFVDRFPSPNKTNYYRLKIFDYSSAFEYSRIENVKMSKGDLSVFPNPTHAGITLQYESKSEEVLNVTISNAVGVILFNKKYNSQKGGNQINIEFADFPKGVYYLRISNREYGISFVVI
jgi:hypothetical protein